MQATLAPPAVWWDVDRWHRRRARMRAAERHNERNGERSGVRLAEQTSLGQLQLRELQRLRDLHALLDRQRLAVPDIFLYSPSRFGNLAPADTGTGVQPTATWRQRPLWHTRDILIPPGRSSETRLGEGGGTGGGSAEPWGAARGWAVGALLLLGALLLVRATDRCLAGNYCRPRRRRSEEWPTPSVLATTHRSTEIDMVPNLDPFHSESSESSEVFPADLPPPYSECAPPANKHVNHEEPPPPYSACYVAYTNPKDGNPSVRIYNGQHQMLGEPTSGDRQEIAHSSNGYLIGDTTSTGTMTDNTEAARAPLATEDIDSDDASASTRNATC